MRLASERFGAGAGGAPLVIAHGLFGAGRNWRALARRLARRRPVVAVDMRNHGASPWSDDCSYAAMAGDLAETIEREAGGRADLLGHSMGGKAAMALALIEPGRVGRLIVADIAPVAYSHGEEHRAAVRAMRGLDLEGVDRRAEADRRLAAALPDAGLRGFLLQNLDLEGERPRWRLNLAALEAALDGLTGWPEGLAGRRFEGEALVLRGAASRYAAPETHEAIRAAFPAARIEAIEGAGHWLHAEKPEAFLAAVEAFLDGAGPAAA